MSLRSEIEHNCPALSEVGRILDGVLATQYQEFFGDKPIHPVLDLKPFKIIHDNVWRTVQFDWRELAVIDSPVLQRLRDVHQTGLAYFVYPSARHSRFEHCLGTLAVASQVFDSLLSRQRGEMLDIAKAVFPAVDPPATLARLRAELRMAALLHDSGHCLHSHTSERVYGNLPLLTRARSELHQLTGKEPGAGEVLSFCLALSRPLSAFLDRSSRKVMPRGASSVEIRDFDMEEVALMIVGATKHPFFQFLADIVTSGFDADKLDYLQRDAVAAGIPVAFDVDRYLFFVRIKRDYLADGEEFHKRLYGVAGVGNSDRLEKSATSPFPGYETYRLRLPRQAMTAIEQIIISKLMLFSYIYHHPKVRSVEGVVEKFLTHWVEVQRGNGKSDADILSAILMMTDSALYAAGADPTSPPLFKLYTSRLMTRVLPREIYRMSNNVATHADKHILVDYLTQLQDRDKRAEKIQELEEAIGSALVKLDSNIGANPKEALLKAGVWLDVPRPPKFEDINELVEDPGKVGPGVRIATVFPIGEWTQAYISYEYWVRIYAFSEYSKQVGTAGKQAMQEVIGIKGDEFYKAILRVRN